MELYEYLKIFKRYKRAIVSVTLFAIILSAFISVIRSSQYEASFSLIIRPKVLEKTENFQLTDAIEASDRVSRMTESWIREQKWGLTTKRLGAQAIKISFQEASAQSGRKRMEDIKNQSNVFISSLSSTGGLGSFEALGADFSFNKKNPYWIRTLLAGFFAGIVIGLLSALFRHYLSGN